MRMRYLFGKTDLSEEEMDYLDGKISKFEKIFNNYNEDEIKSDIKVKKDRHNFWIVELMIRTPHEIFRAQRRDGDFMTAVDMTCGVMTNQVRAK